MPDARGAQRSQRSVEWELGSGCESAGSASAGAGEVRGDRGSVALRVPRSWRRPIVTRLSVPRGAQRAGRSTWTVASVRVGGAEFGHTQWLCHQVRATNAGPTLPERPDLGGPPTGCARCAPRGAFSGVRGAP